MHLYIRRDHSETFCVANLEALAMSLPLVTFGIGGVGQYVSGQNYEGYESGHNSDSPLFTITKNTILVNEATPTALALAVMYIIQNNTLRHALGVAGRRTAETRFSSDRQMQGYRDVYRGVRSIYNTNTDI